MSGDALAMGRQQMVRMFGPRLVGDELLLNDDGVGAYLAYLRAHPGHEVARAWVDLFGWSITSV